jgi:hypothetical protein
VTARETTSLLLSSTPTPARNRDFIRRGMFGQRSGFFLDPRLRLVVRIIRLFPGFCRKPREVRMRKRGAVSRPGRVPIGTDPRGRRASLEARLHLAYREDLARSDDQTHSPMVRQSLPYRSIPSKCHKVPNRFPAPLRPDGTTKETRQVFSARIGR